MCLFSDIKNQRNILTGNFLRIRAVLLTSPTYPKCMSKIKSVVLKGCLSALLFLAGSAAYAQSTFPVNGISSEDKSLYALTNARLFIEPGKVETDAVLLFSEGKIVKAGKGIPVPKHAVVTDLKGAFVYPSFIELFSDYGIDSPKEESGRGYESSRKGAYAWNDALRSDFRAAEHFNPDEEKAAEWRKLGFRTVLTHRRNGILRGAGALVTTGNGSANTELLEANVSMGASFQKGTSKQNYPGSLTGAIALLRQTFYDAEWYAAHGKKIERNLSLESLQQFMKKPFLFEGIDKYDLFRFKKIADEFKLTFISRGNGDEYQRAEIIKQEGIRVALPLNFPQAPDVNDPYDALRVSLADLKHWENAPFNPLLLHNAGVEFALTSQGLKPAERGKFMERIRLIIKNGYPKEKALASLTALPASWLGYENKIGVLKTGALANFFIATGDIFEDSSVMVSHWIQGVKYSLNEIPETDVRGTFSITLPDGKAISVKVKGFIHSPKADFSAADSSNVTGTFSVSGSRVLLTVSGKDSASVYRLEGNATSELWQGKGLDSQGKLFNWSAPKTEAYQAEKPKEKEENTRKPGTVWYPQVAYGFEEIPSTNRYVLKNGTLWTGEKEGILKETDIQFADGKIEKIGKNLTTPKGYTEVDCRNTHITAGIVDEHSHIALTRGVNEGGTANSAEVSMADVINADDMNIYRHLAGGVTTIHQLHGSANPIGGRSSILKLRWGRSPEEMKFENAPGFIKFALGENVKQSNWGEGSRYPQTRLGVEQFFYDQFLKARQYEQQRKAGGASVRRDLRLEVLVDILNGKRFISCHSYVQSEINMLMKVADSLGFTVNTFTHILEGYKVADKMKAHGANASTFSDWWAYKFEVNDAIPYNAAIMHKMGVNTGINSDDAEMARRLNQEAAKAVKYGGVSQEEAWKMVTLNPAKMLRIDNRVGSLKAGKDADIVVWSREPLSIYAHAEKTFVDGVLYFDRERDAELRKTAQAERNRIIALMLNDPAVKGGKAQKPREKKEHLYHCDDVHEEGEEEHE